MEYCLACKRPGFPLSGRPWLWEEYRVAPADSKASRRYEKRAPYSGEAFRLYRQTKGRLEPVGVIHYVCYKRLLREKTSGEKAERRRSRSQVSKQPESARCPECEQEVEPESIYECGACGTTFPKSQSMGGSSNRCECGHFATKVAEAGCPECNTEIL